VTPSSPRSHPPSRPHPLPGPAPVRPRPAGFPPPAPESTGTRTPASLARLNTAPMDEVLTLFRQVCAARAWGRRMLAGRPYPTTEALLAAGDAATAALTAEQFDEALAGHPPIGRPRPGDPVSAREQRGLDGASDALRSELLELNLAYQERFGHVFLICATGRTGRQMRDAIRERIGNTPEREREAARRELLRIHRVRLTRLAAP
jgi:2-oxo-4-hydroxy-4-carboxy-5-ureidoimidazoline decarboxylase